MTLISGKEFGHSKGNSDCIPAWRVKSSTILRRNHGSRQIIVVKTRLHVCWTDNPTPKIQLSLGPDTIRKIVPVSPKRLLMRDGLRLRHDLNQ